MQTVLDSYRIGETQATILVAIDSTVSAPQSLAQGVQNGATALLLNPEVDAIAQITEALAQGNYTSLHLVSHGSGGSLHLGNTKLTVANLSQYRQQLLEWGVAEILIYGCEVAKEPTLLQQLYNLTGANIAASEYKVGKGNWDLSWQLGEITSESAFTKQLKQEYQGEFVGFEEQVTYAAGDNPQDIEVGDFNGDGSTDIVTANIGGNSISVFDGDGSGSFGAQETFATGNRPSSVATGDVYGVNFDQVLVSNFGDGTLSVLIPNYGADSFYGQQIVNVFDPTVTTVDPTDRIVSVALADVDNNGRDDIRVADLFNSTNHTRDIAIGDLDGGGLSNDVARVNLGEPNNATTPVDPSLSVVLSDGTTRTFATGNSPFSIALGDLNNDSDTDIVVSNQDDASVSVYFGDGSGDFATQQTFATGNRPRGLDIGDLDGDGDNDIVVTNYGDNNVSVLVNNGTGDFNTQETFAVGTNPVAVAIGDLDGDDSADDIAVANYMSDNVSVLLECFLTGTHILTDKGEVAVENLQIGDNVVTAEGKLEPVKWIGYQTVAPHQVKNPLRGYPILIKEGALGNNLPQRDLYVSPDHAMYFEGVLINAGALVNGTSIVKTEPQEAFTYYHVELENHTLLLAEGASAESYLPQNEDRLAYENGAEYEELYPHGSNLMLWPMDYPRISSWNKVPRYMRKKLNLIAEELGLVVNVA